MGKPKPESDDDFFYTAKITLRNGKVLYAHEVGKKAFKIPKNKSKSTKEEPKK